MPWRYSPPPATGFCAEYARRKVGKSVTGRLSDAVRRVDRLEAVTVFDSRQPRGLYLQGGSTQPFIPIDFDADGRILVLSDDGSIALERSPHARKSVLNMVVDITKLCWQTCTRGVLNGSGETFAPIGYLKLCKDNGDGTYVCVAVPYWYCSTPTGCGP